MTSYRLVGGRVDRIRPWPAPTLKWRPREPLYRPLERFRFLRQRLPWFGFDSKSLLVGFLFGVAAGGFVVILLVASQG